MSYVRPWFLVIGLLMPLSAMAIRMDCTAGLTSELQAKVTVHISTFLFFQIGSANAVPEVEFDLSQSMQDGHYDGSSLIDPAGVAPSRISGSDVSGGMNVNVRSNCGRVKLAYSVSDAQGMSNGAGQYLPFETLTTTTTDAGLPAPVLRNTADDEVFVSDTAYGSVIDRSATWRYTYTKTDLPVAGTYQGTVSYTATCL